MRGNEDDRLTGRGRARGTTSSASLTFLAPFASDGLFTVRPPAHIVVEPPPSRFSAFVKPSRRDSSRTSTRVMPKLTCGCRPSTVTSQTDPSGWVPMIVRG